MVSLRTRVTFSGSAMLALAMGCAVKQPPAPSTLLPSILPATTTVPPDWKSTAGAAGAIVTEWVATFGDPQLQALVDEGLRNNLDLYAAATRVDVAIALVTQARSLLYPHVAIVSGAGVVGRDSVLDKSGIAGEISWELDLWGRVRAQAASAASNRQANVADLLYARQSLAAVVATTWYQTIASERLRATAEDAAGLYSDLLGLVRTRNQIGQVGQEDVALAGADLDRARQRERAYATSLQQTTRGLEIVLGRYPAAEVALAPELPGVPAPVPAGLPSELLERRPDLVAAERRVAAAFHLIQAAEAARLPRLALTASGGRSTSELLRLAGIPAGFWQAGIGMLAPIFTAGAIEAQVAIANAEQRAALALYGQTALRAFGEVEGALASEQLLADQERYLESVLTQDSDALRLGRMRYDVGATDLLHVLQLQGRQLNTRFELIGLRNDRLANRVALHLALGGGFNPPPATP
jgi:NodT family efflux transporter outer membrane factor (OMF) lipoprotein